MVARKGQRSLCSHYHLQLAISYSHNPFVLVVWQLLQDLLTHGNVIDQTSKLEGINPSA